MKGKKLGVLALVGVMLLAPMQNVKATEVEHGNLVKYSDADTRIVPDKYNTGCQGDLTTVEMPGEVEQR